VIATVLVVALAGYFGVTQLLPSGVTVYDPDPQGNFAFYISDAPNAIGDFQSLELTISEVRLQQEDGEWVEFEPETERVDLTELQGDLAKQIWRGDLPQGRYTEAVLYISNTSYMLKDTGHNADIQPAGNRLHLEMPFEISDDPLTEFVYDITVTNDSGRYRLQPEQEESGTGHGNKIQRVSMHGQGDGLGQCQGVCLGQCQCKEQNQAQGQGEGQRQAQGQCQGEAQNEFQSQGQKLCQEQCQGEAQDHCQAQNPGQNQEPCQEESQGQEQPQEQVQGEAQEQSTGQSQAQSQGESQDQDQSQGQYTGYNLQPVEEETGTRNQIQNVDIPGQAESNDQSQGQDSGSGKS
jgi:hypothetical protein